AFLNADVEALLRRAAKDISAKVSEAAERRTQGRIGRVRVLVSIEITLPPIVAVPLPEQFEADDIRPSERRFVDRAAAAGNVEIRSDIFDELSGSVKNTLRAELVYAQILSQERRRSRTAKKLRVGRKDRERCAALHLAKSGERPAVQKFGLASKIGKFPYKTRRKFVGAVKIRQSVVRIEVALIALDDQSQIRRVRASGCRRAARIGRADVHRF